MERYPTIRAGVIHAAGLSNGPSPPAMQDEFRAQQTYCRSELRDQALSAVPSITAWRRASPASE
ncbi:MAG: hypothetical protein OXS29_00915 [bacterium]|nr:hypothetical protein [bacterium]MDE0289134.1 hypothetical protein [bacterium]